MLLKKIQPTRQLLQAVKDQDVEYIVEITQQLCKDQKFYYKYVDIPKYFYVAPDLVAKTAIRCLIMNGKLNAIYTKSFAPIYCQTDFRLINEDVDCSEMDFVFEPVGTNELVLQKIDRILEYHAIIENIESFQRSMALVKQTYVAAAPFGNARRYVVGSLFLSLEFYRVFLRNVCAYLPDYQVFDSRFEKFALFLVTTQQKRYNQDYFSKCADLRQQILQQAQQDDKLRYLCAINTGQAEIMRIGIQLFVEANYTLFPDFSNEFLGIVQKFKAIHLEIQDCHALNSILLLAQIFGLYQVTNQGTFAYTLIDKVTIDLKTQVYKQNEAEKTRQYFAFFSKIQPSQELLDAYYQAEVSRIHAEARKLLGASGGNILKYAQIPKFMNIPENLAIDAALYVLIAQGRINTLFHCYYPPLPCETDFRLMIPVSVSEMSFYFEPCASASDIVHKIQRLRYLHMLDERSYYFRNSLAEFNEVLQSSQGMDERDIIFGSKFLDFASYQLFLTSLCGYNADLQIYDPNYAMFAQFLYQNKDKQHNEDYFSRCGKYYSAILYHLQADDNKMEILNVLNCGKQQLMAFGIELFMQYNAQYECYSRPFRLNIEQFKSLKRGQPDRISRLVFIVDLYNLLLNEAERAYPFEYSVIEGLKLIQCSPFENQLIDEFRMSETPEGIVKVLVQIIASYIGSADEMLIVLLASENRELNKFGVQFYAYRGIDNIVLLLIDQLVKNGVFEQFIADMVATKRKSIFSDALQTASFLDLFTSKVQKLSPVIREIQRYIDFVPDCVAECETEEQLQQIIGNILTGLSAYDIYQAVAILLQNLEVLSEDNVLPLYGFNFVFDKKYSMKEQALSISQFLKYVGADAKFQSVFIGDHFIFRLFVLSMCGFKDLMQFMLLNLAGYYTNNIALIYVFERKQCFDCQAYLSAIILIQSTEVQSSAFADILAKASGIHYLYKFLNKVYQSGENMYRFQLFHTSSLIQQPENEQNSAAILYFLTFAQMYIKTFGSSSVDIKLLAKEFSFTSSTLNYDEFTISLVEFLFSANKLADFLAAMPVRSAKCDEKQLKRMQTSISSVACIAYQEKRVFDGNLQEKRFECANYLYEVYRSAYDIACGLVPATCYFADCFDKPVAAQLENAVVQTFVFAYLQKNNIETNDFLEFKSAILMKDFLPEKRDHFCYLFYKVFQTTPDLVSHILNDYDGKASSYSEFSLSSVESCYESHAVLYLLYVIIQNQALQNQFPLGSIVFSSHWDQISAFVLSCPYKVSNWYLDYLDRLNISQAGDFVDNTQRYLRELITLGSFYFSFDTILQNVVVLYQNIGFTAEQILSFSVRYCASKKTLNQLFLAAFYYSNKRLVYMQQIIAQLATIYNLLVIYQPKDLRLLSDGQRFILPEHIVLQCKEINNDPGLMELSALFVGNPMVLIQLASYVLNTMDDWKEASMAIEELKFFYGSSFCLPYQLFRLLFATMLLQNPEMLQCILDIYLLFKADQELVQTVKQSLPAATLDQAISLRQAVPQQPVSAQKSNFYQAYHAYKSVLELYKKIVQNSMLFNRKLYILIMRVGSDPILASLQFLMLYLAIADLGKHSQLFQFAEPAKRLKDGLVLYFSQQFTILVQSLINPSREQVLLSSFISDQYLNMKYLLIDYSTEFVEKLNKLQLDDSQKTPNFWLNLLWQHISGIANAEFSSVLASRFEIYSSCMEKQFVLENAANQFDCFQQQLCTNEALYKILSSSYYDYEEQIDYIIYLLLVNPTAFAIIINAISNYSIAKIARSTKDQRAFINYLVRQGYWLDYLSGVLEKTDLFYQALDVNHIFGSPEQLSQLIKSQVCYNYGNQSFYSSTTTVQRSVDECVVQNIDLISSDDDLQSIQTETYEPYNAEKELATFNVQSAYDEAINISQILSNNTAMSVRPEVIRTQVLEKLTEFSDSENSHGNQHLLLASDYFQREEKMLFDEEQRAYDYELLDGSVVQNSFSSDQLVAAQIYQTAGYRTYFSSTYFGSNQKEDDAIILLEQKSENAGPSRRRVLTLYPEPSRLYLSGLSQHEYFIRYTYQIPLDFDCLKPESFYEYSESDQFGSDFQYLLHPFTRQKLGAGMRDIYMYYKAYYVNNITSVALESSMQAGSVYPSIPQMLQLKRLLLAYADTIFSCQALHAALYPAANYTQLINPRWSIFELLGDQKNDLAVFSAVEYEYAGFLGQFKAQKLQRLNKLEVFRLVGTTPFASASTVVRLVMALRIVFVHTAECSFCQKILTKCTACGCILTEHFDIVSAADVKGLGCKRCLRLSCKGCQCVNCQ